MLPLVVVVVVIIIIIIIIVVIAIVIVIVVYCKNSKARTKALGPRGNPCHRSAQGLEAPIS